MLRKKINKHFFEEFGNYVYCISEREIEKVALALNLKTLAFKSINICTLEGAEYEKATNNNKIFKKVIWKTRLLDLLNKLHLYKSGNLASIIFKCDLELKLRVNLKAQGYKIIILPKNPFI